MHTNTTEALKPNLVSFLFLRALFLLICIILNKDPKIFACFIFGLKSCLYPQNALLKLYKTTYYPIWSYHTAL